MKKLFFFVLGIAVTGIAGAAFFFIYFYSGIYSVAASTGESELEERVLDTVKINSVRRHAPKDFSLEAANIEDGESDYNEMCVVCHGGPTQPKGHIGMGLHPDPPSMPNVVKQFKPNEIYWVIANGIKMTGMPGFGVTHSNDEIKGIVAYVVQKASLSPPPM